MRLNRSLVIFMTAVCFFSFSAMVYAADGTVKKWLDVPSEYRKEIADKLEKSKRYTEEQMKVVKRCLDKSGAREILNCFSAGGLDKAASILLVIRDEFNSIADRICGGSSLTDQNKCKQLKENTILLKEGLAAALTGTIEKGQHYLEEKNKLFSMKRKICGKIKEKGCWTWLDERLNIKCNPQELGRHPDKLEQCRLEVLDEVWKRLKTME